MLAELTDPEEIESVHQELLRPSFPAEELVSANALIRGVAAGTTSVVVLRALGQGAAAVAIGDNDAATRITLLSYLATSRDTRGRGCGGLLLQAALNLWRERWMPQLIVAEIEDPSRHDASDAYGDPTRRVRFYARHGARALDLPYFQPSLASGSPRVAGMTLIAWPGTDGLEGDRLHDVSGVAAFLRAYTDDGAAAPGGDPEREALLAAAADPTGIRVVTLEEATRRS